jgi:hypothetical protein
MQDSRIAMDSFNGLMKQGFMRSVYQVQRPKKVAPKCIVCGKKSTKRSNTCSFECAVKVD